MIEQQIIDGRPVTITYLDQGFNPVGKDKATLVKLLFDDGEATFLSTGGQQLAPPAPFEKRRASRRERSRHDQAVHDFSMAMAAAEKPRAVLKKRFGYDDKQIGTLTMAYRRRKRRLDTR